MMVTAETTGVSAAGGDSIAAIERLLKERIGLNAASIGSASVTRAVHRRIAAGSYGDAQTYLSALAGNEAEFRELIEEVIVPETWFFRAHQAFEALTRFVQGEWAAQAPGETLRVLSVPCSTGEEPYSIAMSLLDACFPAERFHIDAVDISTRNLQVAAQGLYGVNSFRSKDLEFRNRHFHSVAGGLLLSDAVRHKVNFQHANLLDPGFTAARGLYHVIFCRNLLIYFDRPTQERALDTLERLLHPQGALFLGHAEGSLVLARGFTTYRYPMAFAFCRASTSAGSDTTPHNETAPTARRSAARTASPPGRQPRTDAPPARRPFADVVPVAPVQPPPAPPSDLDEAFRLADQGHLVEAATLCEAHLRTAPPSARAYYLLALVRDAAGNKTQAEELLRKALYLEPGHYESLVHLALIREQCGDSAGADLLQRRAQRVRAQRAQSAAGGES